jgi:glucuronoarabinoxylan endo-1,4-beta-xylanase
MRRTGVARHGLMQLALAGFVVGAFAQTTVTINEQTRYQTIEGLGAAVPEWQYGNNNDATEWGLNVTDLGMSMLRLYPEPSFSSSQGTYNVNDAAVQSQFAVIKKAVAAGCDRIILSVFSPPAYMKDNGSLVNGGHLLSTMYGVYADFYVEYVKAVKAQCGVDVYAISPENEPAWGQWYNSCIFTAAEMRDAVKAIGRRLDSAGVSTRIFCAEDLATNTWSTYQNVLQLDTAALRYQHALAVHAYENNGVTAGSPSASLWAAVYNKAKSKGKVVWMTETSGYVDTWADAYKYATGIYTSLKYGKLSAWVWLNINTGTGSNEQEALKVNKTGKYVYYTSKNIYKWIRPGAVMTDATSSDTNVLVASFYHVANQTLTVLLINNGSSASTVTLSGYNLPSFDVYRSSSTQKCVSAGTVAAGATVSLPAQSISTLYGQNWTGRAVGTVRDVQTRTPAKAGVALTDRQTRVVNLIGQQVAPASVARHSGVYLVNRQNTVAARLAVVGR